jgi:hypothetical protein
MKFAILLLTITAAMLPATARADTKEMPPGLWEMKMRMDMPGMPPEMMAKMNGRTMTQCVKPGERKWNDKEKSGMEPGDRKCEQSDMKTDGNKVSWKLKCADGTTGEGTLTHNGKDAYTMDNTMTSPRGSMKMHIDGKKIADTCNPK